jgi:hypothetical protein
VATEHFSADGIKFTGCHAWCDGFHHRLAGFGDNPTRMNERIEFLLVVNGHTRILRPEV